MTSRIGQQIVSSISSWQEKENDHLRVELAFPPDFLGFSGHFPDNPIFPGVCYVQTLVEISSKWLKQRVQLTKIARAKFLLPVKPGDQLAFDCQKTQTKNHGVGVNANISCGEKKVAMVKIEVASQIS